jgi:hypothetical protein
VIAGYFQPGLQIECIVEQINDTLAKTEDEPVLLAGDFNCNTDITCHKTQLLLEFLQTEGFELTNNPIHPTFICHNGKSTIDLIFLNPRAKALTTIIQSRTIPSPYRKNLPVLTIETKTNTNTNLQKPRKKTGRHLSMTISSVTMEINKIKEVISEGMIEEATARLEKIMKAAHIQNIQKERKAKPWIDMECYKEKQKVLQHQYTSTQTKWP